MMRAEAYSPSITFLIEDLADLTRRWDTTGLFPEVVHLQLLEEAPLELERVRGEDPAGVTTQVIHGLRRRTRRIPDEEALVHRVAEVVTLMMHERAEAPRPSITFLIEDLAHACRGQCGPYSALGHGRAVPGSRPLLELRQS